MTDCSPAGKAPFLHRDETSPGAPCTHWGCSVYLVSPHGAPGEEQAAAQRSRSMVSPDPQPAHTVLGNTESWAVCPSRISRLENEAGASDGKTNSREVGGGISSHLQPKAPLAVLY